MTPMKHFLTLIATLLFAAWSTLQAKVEQYAVFETSFTSARKYENPFLEIDVDVIFQQDDKKWKVPAFWAGADNWTVRFAPPLQGKFTYRVECSDKSNSGLNGNEQSLTVTPYTGENPLLKRGLLRVTADKRHFLHDDGTPFLWLGDTWWKGLCKRITWEGFQDLTADRKKKGFSVVQIVCGTYPDEPGLLKPSWGNEGGIPYVKQDFSEMNPRYFDYADRRIKHLVDAGIMPAIVGGWGRAVNLTPVGLPGYKRHFRNLIARYGAYPVIWILGGETDKSQGPWHELAQYVDAIDPYNRLLCNHSSHLRNALEGHAMFDFDMDATGHNSWRTVNDVITSARRSSQYAPLKPFVSGESCYELHMQENPAYLQRYQFWALMLAGAAGHTYGAAGIWHMATPEAHGNWGGWGGQPYDLTTWNEGMHFPGSAQLGHAKALLETLPWQEFREHPEWVEKDLFAAGIPGKIRVIYQPNRGLYKWDGITVKNIEPGTYSAFYFDPVSGLWYDQGIHNLSGTWRSPNVPSPQDWVLVMQVQPAGTTVTRPASQLGEPFAESFAGYQGNQDVTQFQTGLKVAHSGKVSDWTNSGSNAIHAVDRALKGGEVTPSDWAVMIFQDNVITSAAIPANDAGTTYRVDFEISPAIYADAAQATRAGDALLIEVLRANNSVLTSIKAPSAAWSGKMAFTPAKLDYSGDGTGPIRLRVRAATSDHSARFHGAIDNITVRKQSD
jgi:hypothetical protein